MTYLKKIVIFVLVINVVFTAAAFYCFIKVGSEPGILIASWFGFTAVVFTAFRNYKKRTAIKEKEINDENSSN